MSSEQSGVPPLPTFGQQQQPTETAIPAVESSPVPTDGAENTKGPSDHPAPKPEGDDSGSSSLTKTDNTTDEVTPTILQQPKTDSGDEDPFAAVAPLQTASVTKTQEVKDHDGKVRRMTFDRSPSPSATLRGDDAVSDAESVASRTSLQDQFSKARGSIQAASPVRHKYHFDTLRDFTCHRGYILYSAALEREESIPRLSYLNCVCSAESRKRIADRTFLEVHTNGIYSNAPSGCCCFPVVDNASFLPFDDPRFGAVGETKTCCSPCPPTAFANCCGCCGETLYLTSAPKVACARPSNFGHCGFSWFGCCFPTSFFYGLQEGEARRFSEEVETAKKNYEADPPTSRDPRGIDTLGRLPRMGQRMSIAEVTRDRRGSNSPRAVMGGISVETDPAFATAADKKQRRSTTNGSPGTTPTNGSPAENPLKSPSERRHSSGAPAYPMMQIS